MSMALISMKFEEKRELLASIWPFLIAISRHGSWSHFSAIAVEIQCLRTWEERVYRMSRIQ
jgi:hypothetical protein